MSVDRLRAPSVPSSSRPVDDPDAPVDRDGVSVEAQSATDDVDRPILASGRAGDARLRVEPAALLMPGTGDAKRLLSLWLARKSFYWLLFLGYAIGTWLAYLDHETNEVNVEWTSPSSVRNAILSPWSAFVLALIVRTTVSWVALVLAAPLAVAHDKHLSPRTGFGSSIGKSLDRLNVARAFRALRWSHHVREAARQRLGRLGGRFGRLDPVLDAINIVTALLALAVAIYVTSQTAV